MVTILKGRDPEIGDFDAVGTGDQDDELSVNDEDELGVIGR